MIKTRRRKDRYLKHKKYVYDTFYLYGLRNQTPPKIFRVKEIDMSIRTTYHDNGAATMDSCFETKVKEEVI